MYLRIHFGMGGMWFGNYPGVCCVVVLTLERIRAKGGGERERKGEYKNEWSRHSGVFGGLCD